MDESGHQHPGGRDGSSMQHGEGMRETGQGREGAWDLVKVFTRQVHMLACCYCSLQIFKWSMLSQMLAVGFFFSSSRR